MHKITAEAVFDGQEILTGQALILDEQGRIRDLLPAGDAGEDLKIYEGLLCPGLINAHCHLELSHMKGRIPAGTGLADFVLSLQGSRKASAGEMQEAMRRAEDEMLGNGTVAVGDIANSDASFALKSTGRLRYHTFVEVFGFNPEYAGTLLEKARALMQRVPGTASLTPHAPYSVSERLFRLIAGKHREQNSSSLISIHNQESAAENVFYKSGEGDFQRLYKRFGIDISWYRPYGGYSLPTYLPWLKGLKKLLVHNTFTRPEDVSFARELDTGTGWCLCPKANLYIENRLPDVPMFYQSGLRVLLGTDSLASNTSLDLLDEMKTIKKHFPGITWEQLLHSATSEAAAFFGWNDLGSFGPGKKPGVNLISAIRDTQPTTGSTIRKLL